MTITIDRAIEILDPEHREVYKDIEEINEARRMGMAALEKTKDKKVELWNNQASCPECKALFGNFKDITSIVGFSMPVCKFCGQKLNWNIK